MPTVESTLQITVKRATGEDGSGGWRLISDTKTDYGKTYKGNAERCTVSWSVSVVTGISAVDDWAKNRVIDDVTSALAKRGGKLLRVQVYNKLSPSSLFGTLEPFDWKLVVDADVSGETSGETTAAAMQSPFPWAFVIELALVAILLLLLKWTIDSVSTLIYGPGGDGGIAAGGWLLIGVVAIALLSMIPRGKSGKKAAPA